MTQEIIAYKQQTTSYQQQITSQKAALSTNHQLQTDLANQLQIVSQMKTIATKTIEKAAETCLKNNPEKELLRKKKELE